MNSVIEQADDKIDLFEEDKIYNSQMKGARMTVPELSQNRDELRMRGKDKKKSGPKDQHEEYESRAETTIMQTMSQIQE